MTYAIFSVSAIGAAVVAYAIGLVARHTDEEAKKYEKIFDIGLAIIVLSFLLMLIFFAGTEKTYPGL